MSRRHPMQISDRGLHALYRQCMKPLDILKETEEFLCECDDPRNILQEVDHRGDTAFGLLLLNVNRGLRFHRYKIPELKALEDCRAADDVIECKCLELDEQYQNGVYDCLKLLLYHGSDCNHIGGSCPGIVHESDWCDGFETKIMQSESRWNLLGMRSSMRFSKYNTFDPLSTNFKLSNPSIMPLHLAAWRGDLRCLELLVKNGAQINARSMDGRNALHFLYHYCNKPSDLVDCTQLLLRQGVDVHATDSKDNTPLVTLLFHIFVKRSHLRHLANQFLSEYHILSPQDDNYHREILRTLDLLLGSGAALNKANKDLETPLHIIYNRFRRCLKNCDEEFQIRGHDIVPYQFTVKPLVIFAKYLIENGSNVLAKDVHGNTAMHKLALALQNLSLDEGLNPTEHILQCFNVLLESGLSVNEQGSTMKTAGHMLIEAIVFRGIGIRAAFNRYKPVLELFLQHGWNINLQDQMGNTVLTMLFVRNAVQKECLPLLQFLLQAGADPCHQNRNGKVPLKLLLESHVLHHDPISHQHDPVQVPAVTATAERSRFHFAGSGTRTDVDFSGNAAVDRARDVANEVATAVGSSSNSSMSSSNNALTDAQHQQYSMLKPFLATLRMLCLTMPQRHVYIVFCGYRESGFCGVVCRPECCVHSALENHCSQPRSLAHVCRMTIWRAMGKKFYEGCQQLPLPTEIRKFVFDLA